MLVMLVMTCGSDHGDPYGDRDYCHVFVAPWQIITGCGWMIVFINNFFHNLSESQSVIALSLIYTNH
jgi:hypothetical protein